MTRNTVTRKIIGEIGSKHRVHNLNINPDSFWRNLHDEILRAEKKTQRKLSFLRNLKKNSRRNFPRLLENSRGASLVLYRDKPREIKKYYQSFRSLFFFFAIFFLSVLEG